MKKRRTSFLIGLFLLVLLFFILVVTLVNVVTMRDRVPMLGRQAIALVEIEGVISDTTEEVRKLEKYSENAWVQAIVLRIESPGGTVGGSQELHRAVLKARKRKPVVASMGNVAASGGYYVACAASEIYTNPGTVTGSIGVVFQAYDLQGVSRKIGIGVNTIKSGKFKDTGSMFREMTPEEREMIQATVNDTHDQFVEAVLESRREALAKAYLRQKAKGTTTTAASEPTSGGVSTDEAALASARDVPAETVESHLRSLADGRVLSGRQALAAGLVDQIGGLSEAIERAGQMAGVRGRPYVFKEKRKPGIWDLIQSRTEGITRSALRHGVTLEYRLCFD